MRNYLFLILIFTAISCNDPGNQNGLDQSFTSFFELFNEDSIFQKSSISFPLPIYSDSIEVKQIEKKDWLFTPLLSGGKNYVTINSVSNDTIIVNYSFEGTGIFVDHYFIRSDDKWFLEKIIDSSD